MLGLYLLAVFLTQTDLLKPPSIKSLSFFVKNVTVTKMQIPSV